MPSREFLLTEAILCCDSTLGATHSRGSSALVLHSSCAGCFQTGNNAKGDEIKRLNISQQSLYLLVTHWCFTAASPWPFLPWPWGLVAVFYLPCVAAWPLTPTHPTITHLQSSRRYISKRRGATPRFLWTFFFSFVLIYWSCSYLYGGVESPGMNLFRLHPQDVSDLCDASRCD